MKLNFKLLIFLVVIWAATFLFIATRINTTSYYEAGPTFFAENGYNFEYKLGFPTPWFSKYYVIPADEITRYNSSNTERLTPSDNFMVYKDISYPVLATQALFALTAPLALLATIKCTSLVRRSRNK